MLWETDPKSAALSDCALKADFTIHHFGQALGDCKADPSAFYQEFIGFYPVKRLKNVFVKFRWNPTSCVAHIYADNAVQEFAIDLDRSIGELYLTALLIKLSNICLSLALSAMIENLELLANESS